MRFVASLRITNSCNEHHITITNNTQYFLHQVHLERKTREAEYLTARLVEESEKRAAEAERLKAELVAARMAEKQAKEKLLNFLSRTSTGSLPPVSKPSRKFEELETKMTEKQSSEKLISYLNDTYNGSWDLGPPVSIVLHFFFFVLF